MDFLIVGQGLAGSLLAWELIRRGSSVLIVDHGGLNASQVAAGLINPVTGRRFVKSEGVDTLLPIAKSFYKQLSDEFQNPFYIEKPLLRLFRNEAERTHCLKRLNDEEYRTYLGEMDRCGGSVDFEAPWGTLEQKQTGYLSTRPLLLSLKDFFIARESYLQAHFDYRAVRLQPSLKWRDFHPERIVFCEGYLSIDNPWFSFLPMLPVKGEILTVEHSLRLPDKILNYGYWLAPMHDHRARIGATFDRAHIDTDTTEAGKAELLSASAHIIPSIAQARLIDHQIGIRPTTSDRQPFLGVHPEHRQLAIFNGFGSKGSLSIPGYCRQFADFLVHQTPLPKPCNIERFYAAYFTAGHRT